MHIDKLILYPVKSCQGFEIDRTVIDARGFEHDRSFMIVDALGDFLTQRRIPSISLIEPTFLSADALSLRAPDTRECAFPIVAEGSERKVKVWQSECLAVDQGDEVASWLSRFLKTESRLVKIGSSYERKSPLSHGRDVDVSFADHYPVVLATLESLAYLNERLTRPVNISRYRPNIVLTGGLEAFQEYEWLAFKIGDVEFESVRVCDRCSVTAVDQETGQVCSESLSTLAQFGEKEYNRPVFGIHASPLNFGEITKDSKVTITKAGKIPLRVE